MSISDRDLLSSVIGGACCCCCWSLLCFRRLRKEGVRVGGLVPGGGKGFLKSKSVLLNELDRCRGLLLLVVFVDCVVGLGGFDVVTESLLVNADLGGFLLLPGVSAAATGADDTSELEVRHRLGNVDEKLGRCMIL